MSDDGETLRSEGAANAQAIALLRAKLDGLFPSDAAPTLTRASALNLLSAILESVGPALRIRVDTTDPREVFVADHPGIILLDQLRDAIADLDNAKSHSALRPAIHGANASDTSQQKRMDRAYLDLVDVTMRVTGTKTRKEAETILAGAFKASNATRKGKPITQQTLKRLRDRSSLKI